MVQQGNPRGNNEKKHFNKGQRDNSFRNRNNNHSNNNHSNSSHHSTNSGGNTHGGTGGNSSVSHNNEGGSYGNNQPRHSNNGGGQGRFPSKNFSKIKVEETTEDIRLDSQRIEKEINLIISEIKSLKL